jgi:hypothetical protein
MINVMDDPILIFAVSLVVLWLSAQIGVLFRTRVRSLTEDERQDFGIVLTATMTLLGLLIGFSFSMAISRYNQRKDYEAEEANAIGTEYVRADLLPAAEATKVRGLLKTYLDQRVVFYEARDQHQLGQIDTYTTQLQSELWSAVQSAAAAKPTPTVALAAEGMNDVLNSQGYTQAAWWNRIPIAAWALMAIIAVCCNFLVGYDSHRTGKHFMFLVLPLAVSISFLLIADIDSPRGGIIRVLPQNLVSLSRFLHGR